MKKSLLAASLLAALTLVACGKKDDVPPTPRSTMPTDPAPTSPATPGVTPPTSNAVPPAPGGTTGTTR